ncbi:MAG: RluA family pseudouridine synthase [Bacteroidales bacterium]
MINEKEELKDGQTDDNNRIVGQDSELQEEPDALYEHFNFIVDKGQSMIRIDKFLFNRIEHVSRNKIQQAAKAGNVLVNGSVEKQNYKVKPLDIISVLMSQPPKVTDIIPEDIPLDVVYEDEDILIVNKKAGMVVHPAYGNYNGTLVNALAYYLGEQLNKDGNQQNPLLVHRIDKDTSGVMVVAKNEYAQAKLAYQFYYHTIDRRYQALVWGDFDEDEGTITGNVARNLVDRRIMDVFEDTNIGKYAITHWRVLERFGYVTLIECKLETGRTHQIRVHMKHIGHPLFNDAVYGGSRIRKGTVSAKYKQFVKNCFAMLPRQALHAKSLKLKHPVTNKEMFFDSDLPEDLQSVIEKWRNYAQHVALHPDDEEVD